MMRAMSLLHPPPRLPAHLVVIWPLIWVQVLALRAAMRAAYGKGVQYHWSVTPWGRVFLASIDWIPGQAEAPAWLKPAAHPNDRIAAALDGRLFAPVYARDPLMAAHPGASRDPEWARSALRGPGPRLSPG
ncbi:MAG: hypothetical protein D6773_06200 [Alphaproteobacteria bacterium]|nr:MAG: hypothetical protein D6773_06200 [Alphaproteobacteria bacterium]